MDAPGLEGGEVIELAALQILQGGRRAAGECAVGLGGADLAAGELVRLTVRGVPATLVYRLDTAEVARRAETGLGALGSLECLDVLLQLPVGVPVPQHLVPAADRRVLAELPTGCVELSGGNVMRRLRQPLSVQAAAVSHTDWKRGLKRAGRFGAYCARVLVMGDVPGQLAQAQLWAGYYGVGLVVNAAARAVLVTEPEIFVGEPSTAAGWLFAEQVFAQVVAQGRLSQSGGGWPTARSPVRAAAPRRPR